MLVWIKIVEFFVLRNTSSYTCNPNEVIKTIQAGKAAL